MEHRMTDPTAIHNFLTAGKAIITLKSEQTQRHFTYRIKRNKQIKSFFVSLLGANQEYAYIGYLTQNAHLTYKTTAKSQASPDAPSQQAFNYFITNLNAAHIHPKLSVYHEGRCARCGRPLTDPDSINIGLGPTCRTALKAGLAQF